MKQLLYTFEDRTLIVRDNDFVTVKGVDVYHSDPRYLEITFERQFEKSDTIDVPASVIPSDFRKKYPDGVYSEVYACFTEYVTVLYHIDDQELDLNSQEAEFLPTRCELRVYEFDEDLINNTLTAEEAWDLVSHLSFKGESAVPEVEMEIHR